jgi:serine phosphatase RsbU (regulator of sigma subunit)
VVDRLDPLDRPIGRLLRLAQVADPQHVLDTISMTVAELGGSDLVLYLVDYAHASLRPHTEALPDGQQPTVVTLEGSLAGRAFVSGKAFGVQRDHGWQVWVPVAERAQTLGVLSMTLPDWDERVEDFSIDLGIAAGHLLSTANEYTDRLYRLRRGARMSLGAEIQWALLPPLTFAVEGTTVAGLLEPAYEVAGDSFDYSLNGDVLDLALFDAMGHGLHSSVLGSLAMSAYRHCRRTHVGAGLEVMFGEIDAVIADFVDGDAFVTALLAQLDITTGRVCWASAGHPQPLHVRRGHALPAVDVRPHAPLGLAAWIGDGDPLEVVETTLEPGDALLLYTDGVVDARDPQGRDFGEERLRDLLEQESLSGRQPGEILRRLIHSVLDHNAAPLGDDATTVYLRWDAAAPSRR